MLLLRTCLDDCCGKDQIEARARVCVTVCVCVCVCARARVRARACVWLHDTTANAPPMVNANGWS